MILELSEISKIDFHAHQVGEMNLSQWIESIALSELESLIPAQALKVLMTARGDLFGVKITDEQKAASAKKAKEYEKSLGIPAMLEEVKKELTSLASFHDVVIYLSKIYDCKPVVSEIDGKIDEVLHANASAYVSKILDRENVSFALLDLIGLKDVEPPFPKDRAGMVFCPTKSILNPVWAAKLGSTSLDDSLELCEKEIKELKRRGFSGFKFDIAYYRPLYTQKVEERQARKAFSILRRTKPVGLDLWETVPIYGKDAAKRSLKEYQDFMMRYLISRAADLNVHVQYHTGLGGPGPHPNLSDSNPVALYDLLMDDDMKRTKVVLLHTGYPFVEEVAIMAAQFRNVYADISIGLLFHGAYRQSVRTILEHAPPQKVLYGSDAVEFPELYGYHGWFIKNNLAAILAEFTESHGWTEEFCMKVADMILNKNARGLGVRTVAV